jgi:outer membrane beta-barrel protein
MMTTRKIKTLGTRVPAAYIVLAGVLVSPLIERSAFALQGGEDPALLPVLVDKRFSGKGRLQTSVMFSTSMVTKFVEGIGFELGAQYAFSDLLAVGVSGGYFFSGETSIMKEVRENFPSQEPPLSDLYQFNWTGGLDVMFVPIYGKMSFASEFDPSFDLYFIGGGGVAGTKRTIAEGSRSKIAPVFNVGFGLRFYFTKMVALRLEFRDYFYPDPGANDPENSEPGTEVGGLTWHLHFQAGLQFAFGGDD